MRGISDFWAYALTRDEKNERHRHVTQGLDSEFYTAVPRWLPVVRVMAFSENVVSKTGDFWSLCHNISRVAEDMAQATV